MSAFYKPYWLDEEDELQHYGVKGMRWGIRKNPEKAYSKAGKKLKKLDRKAEKARQKADKSMDKTFDADDVRYYAKSFKGLRSWNVTGKARRSIAKFDKYYAAAEKAIKWQRSMKKEFKNVKLSKLDPQTEALGKKYAKKTSQSLMMETGGVDHLFEIYENNWTRFNR